MSERNVGNLIRIVVQGAKWHICPGGTLRLSLGSKQATLHLEIAQDLAEVIVLHLAAHGVRAKEEPEMDGRSEKRTWPREWCEMAQSKIDALRQDLLKWCDITKNTIESCYASADPGADIQVPMVASFRTRFDMWDTKLRDIQACLVRSSDRFSDEPYGGPPNPSPELEQAVEEAENTLAPETAKCEHSARMERLENRVTQTHGRLDQAYVLMKERDDDTEEFRREHWGRMDRIDKVATRTIDDLRALVCQVSTFWSVEADCKEPHAEDRQKIAKCESGLRSSEACQTRHEKRIEALDATLARVQQDVIMIIRSMNDFVRMSRQPDDEKGVLDSLNNHTERIEALEGQRSEQEQGQAKEGGETVRRSAFIETKAVAEAKVTTALSKRLGELEATSDESVLNAATYNSSRIDILVDRINVLEAQADEHMGGLHQG